MHIYRSHRPDIPLFRGNIADFVRQLPVPNKNKDRPLFIDAISGESLSFRQMIYFSERLTHILHHEYGVRDNDVVTFFSNSHVYVPAMHHSILALGATVSPANVMYTPAELQHQLEITNPTLIICRTHLRHVAEQARDLVRDAHQAKAAASENGVLMPTIVTTEELIAQVYEEGPDGPRMYPMELPNDADKQKLAYLCFSSGTSGKPKAVMTTHANVIAHTLSFADSLVTWDISAVHAAVVPMTHMLGLLLYVYVVMTTGAPVLMFPKFELEMLLSKVIEYGVTHASLVPPMLVQLAKSEVTERYGVAAASTWKEIISAAAPLSESLCRQVSARVPGIRITQTYGMTEVLLTHLTNGNDPNADPGSIGMLLANQTARLVDDDGKDIKPGNDARGELWLKGPTQMRGYLHNDAATQETITPDGWLKTGDIAVRKDDGSWYIVDRKKELIKSQGHQVAPAELEALLLQHEAVADCAVTGYPLPERGTELPRAFVVLKPSSQVHPLDVKEWFDRQVAKYKRLFGGVVVVDGIPKNPSGKILRRHLRDREGDHAHGFSVSKDSKL